MTLIDIPMPKNENVSRCSFEGVKLTVHKIQYTIGTDGYQKTAFILGENYSAAERLLIESLPPDTRFQIITMADTIHEIHGITPEIEEQLFNMLAKKHMKADKPNKPKLSDRLRGKK